MPNHYDTDVYCKKCRRYMFSYLYDHEDSGDRVCKSCIAKEAKVQQQHLFVIHLEPLEERYTASWHRNIPQAFLKAGYTVTEINGEPLIHNDISVGTFLDINSTCSYKATQLQQIARLFHLKQVPDGSIFFFSDIEFWGIEQVRLLAQMNQVKVFLTGFLHAASYTHGDAFAVAADYQQYTEVGWIAALDQVYLGSEYHKQAVISRRLVPANATHLASRLVVTKNPMFPSDYQRYGIPKEKLMLLTNRFDKEKNPLETLFLFQWLKQLKPDWNFVVTTGRKTFRSNLAPEDLEHANEVFTSGDVELKVGLTKAQYHEYLERAAIVVSHSKEENYGICVAESLIYGCMPLLWNGASHPEHVGGSSYFLFDVHSDDHDQPPSKMGVDADKALALMDRFERDEAIVPSFDWSGMDNIIKAMRDLK